MTFPIIRELLQKRYRDVKVIPYTEFPLQSVVGTTSGLRQRVDETLALALQKGCDAMITGNGF
ncbi:MAG: hypothetical protein HYX92_20815 [Chloroflexi bacterium]|nr:hypothetical protein [Chloroflexota bacterium]